jgi:hypothetical protein
VAASLERVRAQAQLVEAVAATLDPHSGPCRERRQRFEALRESLAAQADPTPRQLAKVMESFAPGLFAGGDDLDLPTDNLDLERWFRTPKGHERRIHGHAHAGIRLVLEGPTLLPTLDAYTRQADLWPSVTLLPFRHAPLPACQEEALRRRRIMRRARSKKLRPALLDDLEQRYLDST